MQQNNKKIRVAMVGLGYIGLPTAALMAASQKIQVLGIDINEKVVETINKGKIHIVEPELDGLVKYCVESGFLKASTRPEEAEVFVVAVPTPFKGDYEPDITYVEAAARNITPFLRAGSLFIIESTSPVGTTEHIYKQITSERPELKGTLLMAYCPERVLPGNVIYELKNNDRVIGGLNEESTDKACEFYSHFVSGQLHKTNAKTAEMCKLVENSYRDVNIAFANELSMICDEAGINAWELIQLANKHPRVKILQPGPGVGGHCIAVDPWFIVANFPKQAKIIKQARLINNYKTEWVIEKIESAVTSCSKSGKKPSIACLGLSFKPDIDDLRESPALEIALHLKKTGHTIVAVEPNIESHSVLDLAPLEEAVEQSDIIVYLVAHREFKAKTFAKSPDKVVLDFVGIIK